MQYTLGLVSVSFRGNTPEEIISASKAAGLSVIEWGSDVHAPCNDKNKLEYIKLLQEKYDIKCSSYGTYFRLGIDSLSELPAYIEAAKLLGTDILRLWCGNKNSEEYTEEEKTALFEECKKASKIAEDAGVVLCMECHNFTYANDKNAISELISAIASDSFCMYWQPNQNKTKQENIEYAEKLSDYTKHIHVFNWKGDNRYNLEDGIDTWKEYLNVFKGKRTLLLEFVPDDKIESLKKEAEALRNIIN